MKKEVDKIFASAMKKKLSTNQKNARKRVERQEKKAAKEAKKLKAAEAKRCKDALKKGLPPEVPPVAVSEESDDSDADDRPRFQNGVPIPATVGPGRQR